MARLTPAVMWSGFWIENQHLPSQLLVLEKFARGRQRYKLLQYNYLMFRKFTQEEIKYMDNILPDKKERETKRQIFWIAAGVGSVIGWMISLLIHYKLYKIPFSQSLLFFVPVLAAITSYVLIAGKRKMGRTLGANLGGVAGVANGLPLFIGAFFYLKGNIYAAGMAFAITAALGIGIALSNYAIGQIVGFCIKLYIRLKNKKHSHRRRTSHHHEHTQAG